MAVKVVLVTYMVVWRLVVLRYERRTPLRVESEEETMVSAGQCPIMATLPHLPWVEMQASRLEPGMRAEALMEEQGEEEEVQEDSLRSPTLRSARSI